MTSELRRRRREFAKKRCKASLRAARAQGCTCHPDLRVEWAPGGVPLVRISHDAWCPLLRVMQERDEPGRWQAVLDPTEPYEEAP